VNKTFRKYFIFISIYMKVYSLKNKCFSNHKSLNLQTEEGVKNMIVGMPKSSSTKIETFEKQ